MSRLTMRQQKDHVIGISSTVQSAWQRYVLFLIYAILISIVYKNLSPWWNYFGFTYNLKESFFLYAACAISAIPSIFLKKHASTFSECGSWIIYILIFLPAMVVPVMQITLGGSRALNLFITIFLSSIVFIYVCNRTVKRVEIPTVNSLIFWIGILSIWALILISILIFFGSSIRFVALDEIYSQRFDGGRLSSGSALVRYSNAILSSAIAPFLIAYGLFYKRYSIFAIGVATQVILFGTLAARATLLSPVFVTGLWYVSSHVNGLRGALLVKILIGVIIITIPLMLVYDPTKGGINSLLTLIYFRTLLISGTMVGVYDQFFMMNPYTYLSNNNIINQFVEYPYGSQTVGQVVMQFLVPSIAWDQGQVNANFLATDGIAAFGIAGIPFASLATALVLLGLNKLVPPGRDGLMTAAGAVFMLSLANTSLLTSLVSGGGILLGLLIMLAPDPAKRPIRGNP